MTFRTYMHWYRDSIRTHLLHCMGVNVRKVAGTESARPTTTTTIFPRLASTAPEGFHPPRKATWPIETWGEVGPLEFLLLLSPRGISMTMNNCLLGSRTGRAGLDQGITREHVCVAGAPLSSSAVFGITAWATAAKLSQTSTQSQPLACEWTTIIETMFIYISSKKEEEDQGKEKQQR